MTPALGNRITMKAIWTLGSGLRTPAAKCSVTPRLAAPSLSRPLGRSRFLSTSRSRVPLGVKIRNYIVQARNDRPIGFPVLVLATTASVLGLGIVVYDEYFIQGPKYSNYPDGVEQQLRVALHYTHVRPDKEMALEYFQRAIRLADESPMDPFGEEFLGLRIRYAEMLEHFGHVKSAVEVLNLLSKDCEEKMRELDQSGKTDEPSKTLRRRLVKGIIQYRVKMSSLYETDYLQDMPAAKQVLSDAIGLLVKETQDPQTKGFTEDNAADMSFEEIAAMLSQMGDLYAVTGEEANAVQVYMLTLQPLRAACNNSRSCKEAQVLSNIASTMDLAAKRPNAKINGRPATKDSLIAARRATLKWADHALAAVDATPDGDRDPICQMAIVSARMTKSDLLLELGDKIKAKDELTGLIPVLKEKGLTQLVPQAEQALQRANA
ncbi:uncharacterized protein HMPREF1541_05283 [Cyphellophora europaea CBS 101466]|uniref:Uncharacterized protein n=1 Tax=Cyphellophora europaea (strain CBS 101466) TaxID=1220924 RepID=W2RRC1_CYPE1|nr:uncharacterized protein HMPREF1541_05283 [Cyphellophora europaea CBS 101466]ETN39061.1 hypothetical protein HMPREF1541_05283 [Cyphellophora europaea CBS 101466]